MNSVGLAELMNGQNIWMIEGGGGASLLFKTPQAALEYLDAEFSKLDTQRENALSLHPLNGNVKDYAELEQLLRDEGSGASLREAVSYYIAHHKTKRFKAMRVSE